MATKNIDRFRRTLVMRRAQLHLANRMDMALPHAGFIAICEARSLLFKLYQDALADDLNQLTAQR